MFSHERIWSAIDRLAEENNLTPSGLARRAGLDPTAFNKSKRVGVDGRQRWPSTESIAKILEATGSSIDQFLTFVNGKPIGGSIPEGSFPPQIASFPLLGFARAGSGGWGVFDGQGYPIGNEWDLVHFPASSDRLASIYALEVQGESMMPLYRDGDRLIVEPGAQVRRGDRVVVKTREGEVMAKVLQRQTARSIELVSLNPDHPNRTLDMKDVEWVARIIWASQ